MVIIDRLIAQMVAAILYSSVAQAIHSHIIQDTVQYHILVLHYQISILQYFHHTILSCPKHRGRLLTLQDLCCLLFLIDPI